MCIEKTWGQHCSIKLHAAQLVLHDENLTYCIAQGTLLNIMWQHGWDEVWGIIDTCKCMAESLCCTPETITTLLVDYSPIQNKKFNKRKSVTHDWLSSVQSLSCVWFFATPWTAARQASLSIINSRSLLKFMSIKLVMPSNHFILCHFLILLPSIFPSIRVFSMNHFFASGGPSIGASTSASVLPMNIQDWFPLGLTGLISLQSKGLSRVFSNTTVQNINSLAFRILYGSTLTSIHDYW